jgi:hypothetical protein
MGGEFGELLEPSPWEVQEAITRVKVGSFWAASRQILGSFYADSGQLLRCGEVHVGEGGEKRVRGGGEGVCIHVCAPAGAFLSRG